MTERTAEGGGDRWWANPWAPLALAICIVAVIAGSLLALDAKHHRSVDSDYVAQGDPGVAPDLSAILDNIIQEHVDRYAIPGLAVGVIQGGRVVYSRGFGIADPSTGRTVTNETLFHLASVSKVFVAAAVLQLVESGLVRLDDPVTAHLPYFLLADGRAGGITIRQMLSHTSGLPDVRDYHWQSPETDEGALERYVRSLENKRLVAEPGERFAYSNMAYEVLGHVIARVSGMTFEDYMKKHLLAPLGMRSSTYLRSEVDPGSGATPHVGQRDLFQGPTPVVSSIYPYHRAHAPSSTLHSNVEEMCIWILTNLNRGVKNDRRILYAASYDLMWDPQVEIRPGLAMGLGWMLSDSPYGLWVQHGGRDVGFRSHVSLMPDLGGGIVILSNYSDAPISEIRDAILSATFPAL